MEQKYHYFIPRIGMGKNAKPGYIVLSLFVDREGRLVEEDKKFTIVKVWLSMAKNQIWRVYFSRPQDPLDRNRKPKRYRTNVKRLIAI